MSINFNITAQGGAVNQTDGVNGEDTNSQESFADAFQRLSMAGFDESEEIILGMMNSSTGSTDSVFYFDEPSMFDACFTAQEWQILNNKYIALTNKQGRSMDDNAQLDCLQFLIDARSRISIDPNGELTADQSIFLARHTMFVALARMRFLN